jgi:hypothetical protein
VRLKKVHPIGECLRPLSNPFICNTLSDIPRYETTQILPGGVILDESKLLRRIASAKKRMADPYRLKVTGIKASFGQTKPY